MAIATVEVDRKAILHNLHYLKSLAPNSEVVAVIKANAYAHGKLGVAALLDNQVDCFGVARLSEALQLRDAAITAPILLLEGFFPHDDINLLATYNLQTVVHSPEQIDRLSQLTTSKPITVWFKIDTGMHRLGFNMPDAISQFNRLARCNAIATPINIVSHFSSADECNSHQTMRQLQLFTEFLASITDKSLIGKCSIAASGGILAWPASHLDVIRPGIALYGVSPFESAEPDLKAAMTFKSELIAVRPHKRGAAAGYGQIWTSNFDTLLGVVAMGYGDGYPRNIPSHTPVLINGRKVPIVGRVSMDMIVIDLGINATDKSGDEVIFWGKGLPVEEIAQHTGISAYELLTRLTARANIHYID